jgi:hypothetical protein
MTTEDEQEKETSLPSIVPSSINIPAPLPLEFRHNQDDTLKANIQAYNTMLAVVHGLWGKANSFGKALALINQVEKLIKLRSEIMGHPYGTTARQTLKGNIVYPDD